MSPSPTGTRGVEPGPRASGRSPASPRAKTPPLLVADQLLDAMHDAGVTYCHWKSNEHVAAGLRGLTDLDLLVDRRQAMQVQAILTRTGFKRFTPAAGMGYPAIEDYIALDAATGRLLHCHLHYRLVAGEAHLKGYRLPWEDAFLEHRRWDAAGRLYVADPNLELLALLARFVTKLGPLHVARHLLGRPLVAHGWLHEYPWLRERIDVDRCTRYAGELLGEEAAGALSALLAAPLSFGRVLRFRHATRHQLSLLRSHGPVRGTLLRWLRVLPWLAAGVNRRLLSSAYPLRRTVPTGGVLVAFLGADGSGKSTHARATAVLLAAKLDVLLTYFGSGDGPTSLVRWPLRAAYVLAQRLGLLRSRRAASRPAAARPPAARAPWALVLSFEKRRRLRAAWRARSLGMVVLADRYPQAQIGGFNDGPLLGAWASHSNALLRGLARWEAEPYRWAERYPPDLVIKLHVSPENALARKPDTGRAEVERRITAIRALAYGPQSVVVDVDADRPLTEVSGEVTRIVWSHI